MNKKSKKNLVPFTTNTAKEAGSKGGKASVKTRRKKKKMKQAMDLLLSLPVLEKNMSKLNELGLSNEDADNQMLMLTVAFQKAVSGDVKAMQFIKEITGSTATTELERQKLKLEKEKLALARERLEFEKTKSSNNQIDDDGVEIINDV
ncbi:hypothetical protein [Thomasclavelia cocleata]|uniref:hypothetical protein n=1 Tax=Thomasclavelia cocleata TaxID=69824 RepID=UPI002570E667|nr:hypothetical protein [Thomasclavelia cocleata]